MEPQDRQSRVQAQRDALRLMPSQEESDAATQRVTQALPQHALVTSSSTLETCHWTWLAGYFKR